MGQDATAIIAYGLAFIEDAESESIIKSVPWGNDGYEEWWKREKGYVPPFELFTESGDYIDGIKPDKSRLEEYWQSQRQWLSDNPMPFCVKPVGYESNNFIFTSPNYFCLEVDWTAVEFEPLQLHVPIDWTFEEFCAQYFPGKKCKWFLAARLY